MNAEASNRTRTSAENAEAWDRTRTSAENAEVGDRKNANRIPEDGDKAREALMKGKGG
jgi:hypothetical protein